MDSDSSSSKTNGDQTVTTAPRFDLIDFILLGSVLLVLVLISLFLVNNMNSQNATYNQVISHLLKVGTIQTPDNYQENGKTVTDTLAVVDNQINAAVLSFARAKDFANIKLGGTLLGFLLIFIGALYLLKVFNLSYTASFSKPDLGNVSIATTSPGLVMITLGVIMAIVALISHNEISLAFPATNAVLATPEQGQKTVAGTAPVPLASNNSGSTTPGATNPNPQTETLAVSEEMLKRTLAPGMYSNYARGVQPFKFSLNSTVYRIPHKPVKKPVLKEDKNKK
jgi:hypothetical protein